MLAGAAYQHKASTLGGTKGRRWQPQPAVLWGYVCITHGSYLSHYFVGKSNACFASLTSQSSGHPWTPPRIGTSSLSFPDTPALLDASYLSGLRVQTPESSPLPLLGL